MTDWRALSLALRAGAPETTCPAIDRPIACPQLPCPDCGEPMNRQSRYCGACIVRHRSISYGLGTAFMPISGPDRTRMAFEPARCWACDRLWPERRPSRPFCPSCVSRLDAITAAVAELFYRRAYAA